jgi:hypothetical protein
MAGAGFGAADADGTWGFKATPDGKVILGNTSDDVIQVTGSLDTNGDVIVKKQFARGTGTINLGSGTTSTINPSSVGAGTILVTASSITVPTAGDLEGRHICTIPDGTIAGQIMTVCIITDCLDGSTGPGNIGMVLFGMTTPIPTSRVLALVGSGAGGAPQGASFTLLWTGSGWMVLSVYGGVA